VKIERSERGTDLISQIHHPAWSGNSNKCTRHKTLNARLLGCIGQVQLRGLVTGIYSADDHINAFEKRNEVIDGISSVADADLDAFGFELHQNWLVGGRRANESYNFLTNFGSDPGFDFREWGDGHTFAPCSRSPARIEDPVSPDAPSKRTLGLPIFFRCCRQA
jgi:hypothetical protein